MTHYGLSTSGPKAKCFNRLLNHQKQLELQVVHAAAEQAHGELARTPKSVPLQILPDEETQQKHFLTHIPYQPWCSSCVCFRARADQHQRTGASRRGGVATISFDFEYTKAVPDSKDAKEVDSMISLVMVDSSTGYVHAAPLRSKNQWDLMVRELLGFAGLVGHAEFVSMCGNEAALRQLQRMAVNARLSLGLATRATTPPPYSHGNSLVENAIGRIRPLAGTLIHYLSEQVGVEFSTNSPWWSWAFRHACWLINRFNANKGATAYELLYNKEYAGSIYNFGEPVFGFGKVSGEGTAKWTRMIFLGKSDPKDTCIFYNGSGLVITRSIRRISIVWRRRLPFYMNFKGWSWQYKTGVGGRVVLTKNQAQAISGNFNVPAGQIEPSTFFDEDAEAVRLKHLEEQLEKAEVTEMALHDRPQPLGEVQTQEELFCA